MSVSVERVDEVGEELLAWFVGVDVSAFKKSFPRPTKDWPFTSFSTALGITVGYLVFVAFGRMIMTVLNPMDRLTYPIRFTYNIVQMMLCSYMTIEAAALAYRNNYNLYPCNAFNSQNPPIGSLLWLFYISKILDFVDTVVIVLGKKWGQLSFLHVYHHATIFMFYWVNVNVGYDGDIYLTIVLNGVIHTIMYTYYFVSMHSREIWWKKYLTMCQMVQFVCMNAQALILINDSCKSFPVRVTQVYLFYIMSLFALFLQFFLASYSGGGKKSKKH
mmetsp:Transcript_1481/g.3189  ORF Transcript_1481/g.3189 Transcript_1481/m.3189 type:complete len:274 (+) Transcript_1481:110-931(+)|eukprot:CAMPEP_0173415756 /NCGR_PEP_ID=MMETSP1356-20130122/85031_1 /TAXON_ID=77927 ORGANISM="Hemiselmis virescens, Strain PCC157" /NCGR_SAMPLE_ID=MMETSP1356 /ASSEMBLY_ACC=CAM_ASM_000847 /LENGTH=273 /DNA_ID=CAMNT_0014378029 /DNA_START=93 /DNA_END=914 /DNA_ORIENTATION=-